MDKDISFALAILRSDYVKRKDYLLKEYKELPAIRVSDALSELIEIKTAITKIESTFID